MQWAGVSQEFNANAFGESLIPLIRDDGKAYERQFAIAEVSGATALVTDEFKYIETEVGPVLFDRIKDPDELQNIARSNKDRCAGFRKQLSEWKMRYEPFVDPRNNSSGEGNE